MPVRTEEPWHAIKRRFHSEYAVGEFTTLDGTICFFTFVRALLRPGMRVLDFGAGRGAWVTEDPSPYRRELRDLRTRGAHVVAADVDPVVEENPCSDERVRLELGKPLPFEDREFDLVVADFVFEHLEDPGFIAAELQRITKSGGWICARTANRYGYVTLASRFVPNRRHRSVLRTIQPIRKEADVFPVVYALNSVAQVRRHFPGCDVHYYRQSGEPAYFFDSPILYRLFLWLHKLIPDVLQTGIAFFIRVP
jgi:SAM-dependent methyltransferase